MAEDDVTDDAQSDDSATPQEAPSLRPRRKQAADDVDDAEGSSLVISDGTRGTKKSQVAKKDHATPKQSAREEHIPGHERKVGPIRFVEQSASELKKVVWPTGQQLWQYFVVVLVFVLFIIALVSLLDYLFGAALLALLG